jgi:hypothetical protein
MEINQLESMKKLRKSAEEEKREEKKTEAEETTEDFRVLKVPQKQTRTADKLEPMMIRNVAAVSFTGEGNPPKDTQHVQCAIGKCMQDHTSEATQLALSKLGSTTLDSPQQEATANTLTEDAVVEEEN